MDENKKTEGLNLQPQALEAEEAVLGSMMIDEDAANKAVSILGSSHHFYKDSHKKHEPYREFLNRYGKKYDWYIK